MKKPCSYRLPAILIVCYLLFSLAPAKVQAQGWYNSAWLYRKTIAIDYTKVGTGPHTNFPVLISRADADLQARAQATGNDILFTSADGTTKISHEIESYTSASGTIVAWVEVPTLSSSANTVLYMYYGNAAAASQQNRVGTWDANFKGVYHLNGAFADATSNAYNGTNTGTTNVTGKISQGRGFVPGDGADNIAITGLMGSPASVTLSSWFYRNSTATENSMIVSLGDHANLMVLTGPSGLDGNFYTGSTWIGTQSTVNYDNGWHYAVYTYASGASSQKLYVDGVLVTTTTDATAISYPGLGTNSRIGSHANGSTSFDYNGSLDEVRVASTARSAGWVLTEYNNQNSPSTFYNVSAQSTAKTFTGTGNFSTAARWTGGTLPVAGDNVIIDGVCTVDNSVATDNIAYGSLIIGTATGHTLSWAAGGTNRLNVLNVSAGSVASTLDMTNGGTLIIRGTWASTNLAFTAGTGTIETRSAITLPAAYATYNNLTVNGAGISAKLGATTAVTGNLTISAGTFDANGFSSTLSGNWINNGTFTAGTARVTFTGAGTNTITGSSTTAFYTITVNKGTDENSILDVQSVITMASGGLTLTNGTFKLSSTSTITPFTADITASPYRIPVTAGLWVNGGTVTTTTSVSFAGLVRVSGGTFNVGNAADESLRSAPSANVIIEGGIVNVAGRFTQVTTTDVITFTMSAGTFNVGTVGNATAVSPFTIIAPGSSFTMSGGTIIVLRGGSTYMGYRNYAATSTVTGGTVQIGGTATPVADTMQVYSVPAIWNLTVNSTNSPVVTLTNTLVVKNNITISGGKLDANNLDMSVGGGWINNGTFTAGTARVTFTGAGTNTITGSSTTAFYTITVNKGTDENSILDVQSVITMASGGLTLTNGTFKLSSTSTITPFTADITAAPYLIPATAGLWVNAGTVSTTSNISIAGSLRISGGILNQGNAADQKLLAAAGATILVDGGTVNLAGRLSYVAATDAITFTITSGTFNVGTVGNTNTNVAPFTIIAAASSFTMSGGAIVISKGGGSNAGYNNYAATSAVTGGTLQIGNTSTAANDTIQINSTPPVWNLTVNSTNAPVAQLANALVVKNDVTISGGRIVANNFDLTVSGAWVNNGVFIPGTGTVTFNGTTIMSGAAAGTTFNNLAVAASSTVTSSAGITALVVNGGLTTGAGAILDLGTTTVLSGTFSPASSSGTIKTAVPTTTSATPVPSGKTWGGTVDYNNGSANQTVAGGTYNNLTVRPGNGRTATASGNMAVNGILTVTTAFGAFDLSTYTLSGTLSGISNSGDIKTSSTSTIPLPAGKNWGGTIYYNAATGSQTAVGGTYNILTINNSSGTITAAGDLTVLNQFKTTAGGTLDMGASYRIINGGTITSNGTVKTAVLTATSTTPIPTGKTWSGTVEYTAAAGAQTAVSGTFNDLRLSNTTGTNTAGGNITINGIFTLSGGTITTGASVISLNSAATVSRTGGHVIGNFKKYIAAGATTKIFEVGDAAGYTPATLSFASITTPEYLTVRVTATDHPNLGGSGIAIDKSVNRYWTLTNGGIVFTTVTLTLNWLAGDVDAGAVTANFIIGKYTGSAWTLPSVASPSATSVQATGLTSFGDYAAGEPCTLSSGFSYAGSPYCTGAGTATPTITGTGGTFTSAVGLSIDPATGAVNLAASTPGTYTVTNTVSNAGGCTSSSTSAIIVNASASLSGASTETCVGGSTGTITASATGGNTPYTYSLNAGAYQASATFTGLAAGTYTLSVKTAAGCTTSISVTVSQYAVSTDNQAATGNNTWIGHMYAGTNFDSYIGQFTEGETFNEVFGGSYVCFPVVSASLPRSIYTESFSVKFRMASTKKGLYVADLGGDDGTRLTVDGTMVYTNYGAQAFSSKPSVLLKLTGASSLLYEYYELSGGNQVAFQNLTLVLANTLTTNTTQSICGGSAGLAIGGDTYGVLPSGITLSGTGYQWSYSTTPGGARTTIAGATGATFTPSSAVAPFNASGTFYIYRNATLSSTNNISPNPYTATTESNAAVITFTVAAISYAGTSYCSSAGTVAVNRTGVAGGTYSAATGLSIDAATGTVTPGTSTAGTYTVSYTIAASGDCPAYAATTGITITATPFAAISYPAGTYCSNGGTAAVTQTGTAGGIYSSTTGLTIDATTGNVTLAASTVGTYTVTYTLAASGGCSAYAITTGITLTAAPSAAISYPSSSYCSNAGTVVATRTGTAGGTYSSAAGLSIDAATGTITPSASTAGTYTVTYSVAASGCATYTTTATIAIVAAPVISQIPTFLLVGKYYFEGNAIDATGYNNGTLQNSPAPTPDRFNNAGKAYLFNGSSQYVSTAGASTNPNNVTFSVWFKTTTTTGGRLIGFGNAQTGASTIADRHIYMNDAGQIYTGVSNGTIKTINSTLSYNDGNWHLVTASLSGTTGSALYIDGALIGTNPAATSGANITGYLKIGYDNLTGWPSQPSSFYFNGSLDDVTIYQRAITPTEAAILYNSPDGAGNNGPLCIGSTLNLTATTVSGASYAWTGPNGFTSALQNPTLAYAAVNAGTYTVGVTASGCTSTAYTNVASGTVAGQWTGNVSTDWATAGNWCNGVVPGSSTNVVIAAGATRMPSVISAVLCNHLTVNAGAILTITSTGTLNIGGALTNYGTYTDNGTTVFSGTSGQQTFFGVTTFNNLTLNNTAGLLLPASIIVKKDLTLAAGTLDAAGFAISVAGNWVNNASVTSFSGGAGTVTFNGSTAQAIGGAFTTSFNNLTASNTGSSVGLSANINIADNLSVLSGTFNLGAFTANRTTAGGTITVANNAILKIGGTGTFPAGYTTAGLVVASTVEYSGTNQTVSNQPYGNLAISSSAGAAVKTFPATALTVAGNLTSALGAGTSVSFTAASNITVNGNITLGASTTFNGGSYSHSVGGNWTNNGTFTGNTSTVIFTGSGSAINGTGTQNFNNLTVAASGITFSSNTITLTGNLATTGSGSFTQASGGTLVMSGSGKTINGTSISLNNLTISGSVTTPVSFLLSGNLAVSGSFSATDGTITMSGASKTISGGGAVGFYILNPLGTITSNTGFSIASSLIVNGSFSATSGTATFTGTSSLSGTANLYNVTINGTSLQLAAGSVLGIANLLTVTSGMLDATTSGPNTVNFNGAGVQSINAITYSNLTLSNGGAKTAVGNTTTLYDITIATGTTFAPSSYTHSVYGNWNNNGTFNAGTSTVLFLGPANRFISGATTFNVLTCNTTNASTELLLQSNVSAATVNMANGIILTGVNTLTITGTRTGNGYIYGHIQRTHAFTTGVAYAFEGPDNTITFSSVSGVSTITVSVTKGAIADFPFGGSISRVYDISVPSGSYTATLRLHYEDAELNGNNESSIGLWRYTGLSWGSVGKTASSTTANYVEQSGLSDIANRWTASDDANLVRWNGSVSTDWNTAANWTVLQGSGSRPPSASDIVDLGGATFVNQPTITSSVAVKNIIFGSAGAVTLTLGSGGSLTASGDISGNWSGNAIHTINVNNQSLTVAGSIDLSDGTAGHAIHLNIGTGSVTTLNSITEAGGANVTFSGAGTLNIYKNFNYSSGTFTAGSGTVTYNGTENQAIANLNYNNLTINKGGGLASINNTSIIWGNLLVAAGQFENHSTTTVAGNVTINAGGTFNDYGPLHVQGNWTNNGTYIPISSSIFFDGSGPQSISASTFNNLIINKPAGTATLTGNVTLLGDLTISSGTFDLQTYNFDRNLPGGTATTANGATFMIGANNPPRNFTNNIIGPSSTTIFYGTTPQFIGLAGITFGNLIFRGTGVKTVLEAMTVNGDLTIDSLASLNATSSTFTLLGNWTNRGTFIPSASTVLCTGTAKTITGTTTFNKATITGSYTIINNTTFNDLLNITSAGSLSGGSTLQVTMNGDLINSGILYNLGTTTFTGNVLQTLSLINAVQTVALTVNFNGTVSPVLNSTSTPQYGYLTINNTGGINASVGYTILYSLTVGSGASFNGGPSTHTILGSVTNNGTITSSGTLVFTPSSAVTLNLGSNFTSTGRVYFGGAGAMTLTGSPGSFNNVNINTTNVAGITPSSAWSIAKDLRVVGGSVLNAGSYTHLVGGNLSNSGTINSGTGTFVMNGTGAQDITTASPFNNLTINKGSGVTTLSSNVAVNGTLNFVAGKIQTGSNVLSVPASGSVTGAAQSTGWVAGKLQKYIATGATAKTFEVGDSISYTPAAVTFNNVTAAGNLTVSTTPAEHPAINNAVINPNKSVNRYWTITNSGVVFTSYAATFSFVTSDVDAGAATSAFKVNVYNGSSWSLPVTASPTATSIQATGLTSVGDFAIGEVCNEGTSISYVASPYCSSSGTAAVTRSGTSGGTYTSTTGLVIDATTGAVTLAASTAGTYTVTYTLAASGGCRIYTTTATITITTQPFASGYYGGNPYCSATGIAYPSGGTSLGALGTLSSTAGLSIDPSNGVVNLAASAPGNYTVTYTVPASGGCALYTSTTTIQLYSISNNAVDYTNGAHGVLCATAAANATATLTAPAGTVFSKVDFASYGSPGGSCANFTLGSCHAATSQPVAETYLLGNNTAAIAAANAVFGDPCSGTVKQLYIQATYTQPICAGTAPGTITGTTPAGGSGAYTYLWERSTTGTASGFSPAPGTNNTKDYIPGTLTQTTWYRRTVMSGGCNNTSAVIQVTVTAPASATISYPTGTYCSGGGTAAVTRTGTAGGTYSSTPGLSINSSTGGISLASSTPGAYTVTYTIAASGGCSVYQTTASVTITTPGTWSGSVSTEWNESGNWLCAIVPATTTNVIIPAGLANYPVLNSGSGSAHDLTLQGSSSLTVAGATLQISGSITNSGGTFTATGGTIEMNGTAAQSIAGGTFAANTLESLVINNPAGVTLGGSLNITDALTVSSGSLASNGYLTLRSSATATARVAPITSLAATPISGNVTVERYVPGRRRYRLITSPVTTSSSSVLSPGQEGLSMWGNWQNSGNNTTAGKGTIITGGTAAGGFDPQTTNASLYTYNDATKLFVPFTTTNGKNTKYTPLKAGIAYYMFVYGDRTNTITTPSPNATVLKSTGTLLTGDQAYTTTSAIPLSGVSGKFTLLGNPFASPINWATIARSNVENTYWGWDPNLSGTGGYITVTTLGGVTLQAPFSGTTGLNQYIQSGQGFFVRTSGAAPQLTIREQDKASAFNGAAFRTQRATEDMPLLAVNLQYASGAGKVLADGVVAAFDAGFSPGAGSEDAAKMESSAENIAIRNDTAMLSIDGRPLPQGSDTVFLSLSRLSKPQYTLQIFSQELQAGGLRAYVDDRYLGTHEALSLVDTNYIMFTVSAGIPASSAANRFRIVFQSGGLVLPVTYTSVKGVRKGKAIQVEWGVTAESGIKRYEVERSGDGIVFSKTGEVAAKGNNSTEAYGWLDAAALTGSNYYRVRAIKTDDRALISQTVMVKMEAEKWVIKVFPNPVINGKITVSSEDMAKGDYTLSLHNQQGQQVLQRAIHHAGGALNQVIYFNKIISAGMYYLEIGDEKQMYRQTIVIE